MHLFYFAKKKNIAPDILKQIIEAELINEHHWLPQDIDEIPYKRLQTYFAISSIKRQAVAFKQQTTQNTANQQSRARSGGSGTKRKWETTSLNP